MSNWEQQPDGSFMPSADLLARVRANPAQYPDAATDFAKVTGKSVDEVRAILDNEGSSFGVVGDTVTDMAQGTLNAVAVAAENLVPEETLGEGAAAIRDFAGSLDPKFETEKGLREVIAEGAGTAVPAVAATVGTGGLAGLAIGAGVTTLTMSEDDNLMNTLEQVAPGIAPDILVIQPDDSESVRTMKTFASNAVTDALSIGAFALAGKALKGLAKGLALVSEKTAADAALPISKVAPTAEALTEQAVKSETVRLYNYGSEKFTTDLKYAQGKAGDPSAVSFVDVPKNHPALENGNSLVRLSGDEAKKLQPVVKPPKELEEAAAEASSRKLDASLSYEEYEGLTKARTRQKLLARIENAGSDVSVDPVNTSLRDRFLFNATASIDRLDNRIGDITDSIKKSISLPEEVRLFGTRVYDALHAGDDASLLKLAREGIVTNGTVNNAYAQTATAAFIREALKEKQIGFDEMITLLRKNPDLTSKQAAKLTLDNLTDTMVHLTEIDRALGSSASYQMHFRKGLIKGDEHTVREAETFLKQRVKEELGIDLFTDKFEFIQHETGVLRQLGLEPEKVLPMLEDLFNEFDAARRGTLANIADSTGFRLSKADKATLFGSFVRTVKELQTTALLSQFSTAALEAGTNTLSNLLLPVMEHGLASGNWSRAGREYAGYLVSLKKAHSIAWASAKAGKGMLDDFDISEGVEQSVLAYERYKDKPMRYLLIRMFKMASDAALYSSEFWKATRASGLAYADGLEIALKAGKGRREAKRFAQEYASSKFSPTGQLLDARLGEDVARTSWQSKFDTRYWTGRLGQSVDNARNRDDVVGLMSRAAIPFFRTLVNIGSDSVQYIVPPGMPSALRMLSKTPEGSWLNRVPKFMRALDDFTGRNGETARLRAVGRQRLGLALGMGAYSMVSMTDGVEITGSSKTKRWDAKKRAFEEYPANSLIIGETAYDLSRALPFSAPLMLVGMLRDMEIEDQMHIEGGNYSSDNSAADAMVNYLPAIALTTLTLFQDSAATQGVFGMFDAFSQALEEGNTDALATYLEKYTQQFTPGLVKMTAKNLNTTSYEGGRGEPEDFFTRYLAAAGFPVGYQKLDFIGEPIVNEIGRGINPLNPKAIHVDSPIHKEFAFLNKLEGLALVPPKPDAVFDKAYWKKLGVQPSGLFGAIDAPSLTHLKTASGKDAWEQYRDYLYNSTVSKDSEVPTASQGDNIDIGKVLVLKGEDFKSAMSRLVETPSYQALTPDARAKVWNAVFTFYKKMAKDQLGEELVVSEDMFQGSRYGSPVSGQGLLAEAEATAKPMAVETQTTKGSPLDAAFQIKR